MLRSLFEPIAINQTEIKNRIVYPALNLLYSCDGHLTDRHEAFFRERARGGAGIVTVGPVGIGFSGSNPSTLRIGSDSDIPAFASLVKTIQSHGAKAWIQLFHAGAYLRTPQSSGRQGLAPSAIYNSYSKNTPREMTLEEIHCVQSAFVTCAERAQQAGFDGVEIIGSAGYLVSQFLSPLRNRRSDIYGGSFDNRVRFVREIIELMRARLGHNYPVTIRLSGNDFMPGGNTDSETPAIARVLESAGIDAFSVTGGWHESRVPQLTAALPRGGFAYLAQNIKADTGVPIIASNRISDPFTAARMIREGWADMVNLGRVLLADPYWPVKAQSGHSEYIRPCVACMQGCMDELMAGRPVKCSVNARAGFESIRKTDHTDQPKRIMVIGAGPAGMEAAYRAAQAGHQVALFEKEERIGGQLWVASAPPHKQELIKLVDYYQAILPLYGVEVYLNTEVDIDMIKLHCPDHVIVAEGSEAINPLMEGIAKDQVASAWDVLKGEVLLGNKVVIVGGGAVGLETALFIAQQGTIDSATLYFMFKYGAEEPDKLHRLLFHGNKEVTVLEKGQEIGKGIGRSSLWGLKSELQQHGVNIITGVEDVSFRSGIVDFVVDGEHRQTFADSVVTACGSKPVTKITDVLAEQGIACSVIGDSSGGSSIGDAIHQAYLAVMNISRKL